jgi:hypothetical protein
MVYLAQWFMGVLLTLCVRSSLSTSTLTFHILFFSDFPTYEYWKSKTKTRLKTNISIVMLHSDQLYRYNLLTNNNFMILWYFLLSPFFFPTILSIIIRKQRVVYLSLAINTSSCLLGLLVLHEFTSTVDGARVIYNEAPCLDYFCFCWFT